MAFRGISSGFSSVRSPLAGSFGTGAIGAEDLAAALQGAVVKDEEKDKVGWKEYLENVMKKRGSEWLPLYRACRELNGK